VDIVEGGERPGLLQVGLDVTVLLVDAPEDLESKGTVLHVLTEVVIHPLHPTAVVIDAQIALYEEPKLCVKGEGAHLTIVEELLLVAEQCGHDRGGGWCPGGRR
jgi:hypothetical protein